MPLQLKSFKLRFGKKVFDYREGENLSLRKVTAFFQKDYEVRKIWQGERHIFAILFRKRNYFLKLSKSEGISKVLRNELNWNDYFNTHNSDKLFKVPKNYDSGLYENKYFYLITDYLKGKLICPLNGSIAESNKMIPYLPKIFKFAELIENLPKEEFSLIEKLDFMSKVRNWFEDIPSGIRKQFNIELLLNIVEGNYQKLDNKPKHGDFTPWHLIIEDSGLALTDGEHAQAVSIQYYDIAYFIQRVFSVLKNPKLAKLIYLELIKRNYDGEKLKCVLAARAIGGFLDDYISTNDYSYANYFKDWIIQI